MGGILDGKAAVVTGAGRGIGREVARDLAAEGAKVVVCDYGVALDGSGTDPGPANETVAQIKKAGGTAVACVADVRKYTDAEKMIQTCLDNFGKLDIVACIAGILRDRMVFNMTEAEWKDVIDTHLHGTWNVCRHASVLMRQQRSGRIITCTSTAWLGTTGHCNYGAAKSAIVSLTYALARELGSYGVTANCLAPGAGDTRMSAQPENVRSSQLRAERGIAGHWSARGKPDERREARYVPPIVVYLCSDEAKDINGWVFGGSGGTISVYSYPEINRTMFKPEGKWTVEEISDRAPVELTKGLVNVAPPRPPKQD